MASGKRGRSVGNDAKVEFAPGNKMLVALEDDGPRFWDATTGRLLLPFGSRGENLGTIAAAAFSPDGQRLVTFGFGSRPAVRVWNLASGERLWGCDEAGAFAFSPDGKDLAVAGNDLAFSLCDSADGTERGYDGSIDSVAFLHGGRRLVRSAADGTILVWATP